MIALETVGDYLLVFLIAAVSGLVGGVAAELLLNRDGETGAFELPSRNGRLFDLGGLATVLVGAVVGVAILLVFPPEITVVNQGADGESTTSRSYDLLRLVATSLVAGSAGGSVLSALQARVTAAVNASRVEWVRDAGAQEVNRVAAGAKRQLTAMAEQMAPGGAPAGRMRALGDRGDAPARAPEDAAASAADAIDALAAESRRALAAAGRKEPGRG
ncbi:MAG TPA: hypothetical protein VHK06_02260 [Candidatus Limnocylindria bacterium]|nr:hypothetical protein [Candidatus Limnocylindria bacterium]